MVICEYELDCFAALAMTLDARNDNPNVIPKEVRLKESN